jgi:hypothetical protein
MPKRSHFAVVFFAFLSMLAPSRLHAQSAPNPNSVPVIDGGIGPCTADFTITDNAAKPIYDANITVHIAYGLWGTHKLDLQVGTNVNGKARFTGLPSKTKQGLFFQASQGTRAGSAFDDTVKTCQAQFTIALEEKQSQ